jgi:cytochrome c-type biogenesis protein
MITLGSLLALFFAGLLTFASPCVLPMLPLYLSTLGGAGGADDPAAAQRLRRAGIGFAIGLAVVFVALGAGASALGSLLAAHRRAMAIAAGALLVLFGAKLAGLVRIPWLDREARPLLDRVAGGGTLWSGVLFGAAFAAGWTPCVGPVLGATLTFAASDGNAWSGAIQLAAYAAGMAAPLVAASFAAPAVLALTRKILPATPILQRATGALVMIAGVLFASGKFGGSAPAAAPVAEATCHAENGACAAPAGEAGAAIEVPQGKPRLIAFESAHCTACARMEHVVRDLEARCAKDRDTIVRVAVDDPRGQALAARYGVRFVPTFVGVDAQGEEVERSVGEQPRERIAGMISEVRGERCHAAL